VKIEVVYSVHWDIFCVIYYWVGNPILVSIVSEWHTVQDQDGSTEIIVIINDILYSTVSDCTATIVIEQP